MVLTRQSDYACPSTGPKLELGSKDDWAIEGTLTPEFDRKIHSVFCAEI